MMALDLGGREGAGETHAGAQGVGEVAPGEHDHRAVGEIRRDRPERDRQTVEVVDEGRAGGQRLEQEPDLLPGDEPPGQEDPAAPEAEPRAPPPRSARPNRALGMPGGAGGLPPVSSCAKAARPGRPAQMKSSDAPSAPAAMALIIVPTRTARRSFYRPAPSRRRCSTCRQPSGLSTLSAGKA